KRREPIERALDHWLEHDYRNPNWWHNEVGTPQLLGSAALLLGSDLSQDRLDKIVVIMKRSVWTKWTGQNLVWGVTNQIMRGLLQNDPALVTEAYSRLYDEVRVSMSEGIQPDFSFHQHGPQLYSGGYGLYFAQDLPRFAR